MGKVSDLLISGSSSEELQAIVDTARAQNTEGYVKFLEEQLKIRDEALEKLKSNLSKMETILNKNNT